MFKAIIIIILIVLTSASNAAAYLKIGEIKGESKAMANAKKGYDYMKSKSRAIEVPRGGEGKLAPGFYLHPNGKVLKVGQDKKTTWLDTGSKSAAIKIKEKGSGMSTGKRKMAAGATGSTREKGSGMATGKRQHKPVTIVKKSDCAKGTVIHGPHTGKKCTVKGNTAEVH